MDMNIFRCCKNIEEMGKMIAELNKKGELRDGDIFFCGEDPYVHHACDTPEGMKTEPVMHPRYGHIESDVVRKLVPLEVYYSDMIESSSSSDEYYAKIRQTYKNADYQYNMRVDHFGKIGDVVRMPISRYYELLCDDCSPYPGGCWVVIRETEDSFFILVAVAAFTASDKVINRRLVNLKMAIDVYGDYPSRLTRDDLDQIFDTIMKESNDIEEYHIKIKEIFRHASLNYICPINAEFDLGRVEVLTGITLKAWYGICREFRENDDVERVPLYEALHCGESSLVCITAKKFVSYY